jgi:hypothetical protein
MSYLKNGPSVVKTPNGIKIKMTNLDPEAIGGFPEAASMIQAYDENIEALEAVQSAIYTLIEFCKANRNALDAFSHDMDMETVQRFRRHGQTMYKQLPTELKW